MEAIEQIFPDKEGNHLLVALYFCDDDYKRITLNIPEEYADIKIVDINIGKAFLDKPINPAVFFRMSSWMLQQFEECENAIFTFICSVDELDGTNHPDDLPQTYRWNLFDRLYQRVAEKADVRIQDVAVGADEYKALGRAFYRAQHAPVVHIVTAHLKDKQQ